MRRWRPYLAAALVLVLALVLVRVIYVARHRTGPGAGGIAVTPGPVLITPATTPIPNVAPSTLTVISAASMVKWAKTDPGEITTIRAIQGLVNRQTPSIFILVDHGAVHDQDWLNLLGKSYKATVREQADSAHKIDQLPWYIQTYRSHFDGYVIFDAQSSNGGGPSSNVALSLAGVLNAVPIDRNDSALIAAAKTAGLTELADVSNRDYAWLRASGYWSKFNRDATYLANPAGLRDGADFSVALGMAAFWDDVRSDPSMGTMASMLTDQRPGGIVFGWGYTDAQHREDIFVGMASRHNQSLMDVPPNLSVYMHYPVEEPLKNPPLPALPGGTGKHYVAFLYSDGDNPRVILNELTQPGNDRYASRFRGSFPVGWTLPPTIPGWAGPVVRQIYATATPADMFLSGPSGYGYAFPSLIPEKTVFADQTREAMARLGLQDVLVLDTDGRTGFSHAALDPLTAQPQVSSVFFTAFNGVNQPPLGSVLWSNGKPVFANVTLQLRAGQVRSAMVSRVVSALDAMSRDDTSAAAYTIFYVDFWTISMTDLHDIISQLDPNVVVVRPDVLAALARANIGH
jgi:hypothetical protein